VTLKCNTNAKFYMTTLVLANETAKKSTYWLSWSM